MNKCTDELCVYSVCVCVCTGWWSTHWTCRTSTWRLSGRWESCGRSKPSTESPVSLISVHFCDLWRDKRPSMVTHARTHTAVNTHTHTPGAVGEQLQVRYLAQGHLSCGIDGGQSLPHWQFLPARDSNPQSLDYESDSLTIRPCLGNQDCCVESNLTLFLIVRDSSVLNHKGLIDRRLKHSRGSAEKPLADEMRWI